jgi:hypothetical protein
MGQPGSGGATRRQWAQASAAGSLSAITCMISASSASPGLAPLLKSWTLRDGPIPSAGGDAPDWGPEQGASPYLIHDRQLGEAFTPMNAL